MHYDIRLHLHYDYARAAGGGRHQVRVVPQTIPGVQRVIASSLAFTPKPAERSDFTDFFGNGVTAIAFRDVHETLDIRMSARVAVSRPEPGFDVSPDIARLQAELAGVLVAGSRRAASFRQRQPSCRHRARDHRLCARQPVGSAFGDRHRQRFLQPDLRRLRL